jgi:hypothetical protein
MFNRVCKYYFCLFILIVCVFSQICHAARRGPGIASLKSGIVNYEAGNYDDAILKLEIALIQLPEYDKEGLWKARFYLGLSYYNIGEYVDARKEINKLFVKLAKAFNKSDEPVVSNAEKEEERVRVKDGLLVRNGLPLKVITKKKAMIHKGPISSSPVVENVSAFKSLFLFSADPESSKQDMTTNGFYRVGQTPDMGNIMGWVNGKYVQEWNHREVAGFAPLAGRKPAKIYKTKNDLKIVLQSKDPDVRVPVAREVSGTSKNRYKVLLPILDISNENIANQKRGLCQVAFLESPDAEAADVQCNKSKYDGYGQIDIMFVIDTSRGMKPYVDGLREVVKPLSELIGQYPDICARFGIVAYRDRISLQSRKKRGYIQKTYTALTDSYDEFKAALDSVAVSMAGSESTPAAVFDGLNEAINANIGWRESGVKLIILIGDASADVSEEKNPLKYTLSGLLKDAEDREVRIYAIKLDGGGKADSEIQEKQWKGLAKGITLGTEGAYIRVAEGTPSVKEYKKKIQSSICKEFGLAQQLYEIAEMYLDTAKAERVPEISDTEIMVSNNLVDILPAGNKAENQRLNFSTGWVQLDQDGIPIIKSHLMMSGEELELLSYLLDSLQMIVKGKTNVDRIKKTFIQDLESISGGEFNEEEDTIKYFVEKKMGIPLQPEFLRFTLAEINKWSTAKRKSIRDSIKEKSESLRAFHGDQANWHAVTDDYSYAYVPIDLLP